MVSIDYPTLFHKSMYVMTQFHYFSHNLAMMMVSELQILFVTSTQTEEHVVNLNFLKLSILKIGHCDLVILASQYLYYLWLNPHLN